MYTLENDGSFVIENYNWATSFANFFPGIAGKYGIPLWTYYVSRHQGVISSGVRDKNGQIMEFLPFNKALEMVGIQGFRTWIRRDGKVYEPFCKTDDPAVSQKMTVTSHGLSIMDRHDGHGLTTEVEYFQIPRAKFPALARRLTITNSGPMGASLEVLDGLPRILARGMDQHCVTTIARHVEGMIEVALNTGVPLYRLKQSAKDSEEVDRIEGGHFYISLDPETDRVDHGKYLYDPAAVFMDAEIYTTPWAFIKSPLSEILSANQIGQNRTPAAMTGLKIMLAPGESRTLWSLTGSAATDRIALEACAEVGQAGFFENKRDENQILIEGIKNRCLTMSGDRRFDGYCGQTFLDNVIRGGMPVVFPTADSQTAFYLYSRQNGDLERDYHHFIVEPTYFSQGTGHYRSVNQNRRADTWFFPQITDRNIVTFMNLIQFDGYNPLEVTQMTYRVVKQAEAKAWVAGLAISAPAARESLERICAGESFAPGDVIMALESAEHAFAQTRDEFLAGLLQFCRENESGAAYEGFWTDHWLYNFDLVENFLMIFPERVKELFVGNTEYYFYDDPDVVMPRSQKHVLVDQTVFQFKAVTRDPEKKAMLAGRTQNPLMARTRHGEGEVYRTCLLVKLLCQAANRLASIDASGVGVELEADKPGWNDSTNGLPGIFGSSLCQMIQLENILGIIAKNSTWIMDRQEGVSVPVYSELLRFIRTLKPLIATCLAAKDAEGADFAYWDASNAAKEKYREETRLGIDGGEDSLGLAEIVQFATDGLALVRRIYQPKRWKKCVNPDGVPYTYFRNHVTKYEILKGTDGQPLSDAQGRPRVRVLAFEQEPMPLFLEGPVHLMRIHPEMAGDIYRAVRKSALFDTKLKMYKVCESLEKAPFEIGRVKAWGPGWIENESVYTHMLYKYLLEVLKSGLYEEYYQDITTMMMCFLDPAVYGRSPLENVSFIVSSVFPDASQHGRGLQARLSGVTGEMIHQWILMVAGRQPFTVDPADGSLVLALEPALPASFFTEKDEARTWFDEDGVERKTELPANSFAARLFGSTLLVYRNQGRKATFGPAAARVVSYRITWQDGRQEESVGQQLRGPTAEAIRSGQAETIEAVLG